LLLGCAASAPPRPDAPKVSSDEYTRLLDQTAAEALDLFHGKNPGLDPGPVEFIRVVDPSEWGETLSTCLSGEGFSSAVVGDHVETDIFPPEQTVAYDIAVYTCRVQYPVDPAQSLPFTTDELKYLYNYYASELTGCLSASGISVEDAPSYQKFEDGYASGQSWDPYASVTGISDEAFQKLVLACPPWPDGFRGH
jgi:hypothetical protein